MSLPHHLRLTCTHLISYDAIRLELIQLVDVAGSLIFVHSHHSLLIVAFMQFYVMAPLNFGLVEALELGFVVVFEGVLGLVAGFVLEEVFGRVVGLGLFRVDFLDHAVDFLLFVDQFGLHVEKFVFLEAFQGLSFRHISDLPHFFVMLSSHFQLFIQVHFFCHSTRVKLLHMPIMLKRFKPNLIPPLHIPHTRNLLHQRLRRNHILHTHSNPRRKIINRSQKTTSTLPLHQERVGISAVHGRVVERRE